MSEFLRLLGGILILLCAFVAGREYRVYANRRISQYQGFVALLSHIEGMVSRFLSFGSELWRGFDNDALNELGFTDKLREGESAHGAIMSVEKKLLLGDDIKNKLVEFFRDFGSGYKDSELERVSCLCSELEVRLKKESEELEKNVKVVNALLVGGALGIIILLL